MPQVYQQALHPWPQRYLQSIPEHGDAHQRVLSNQQGGKTYTPYRPPQPTVQVQETKPPRPSPSLGPRETRQRPPALSAQDKKLTSGTRAALGASIGLELGGVHRDRARLPQPLPYQVSPTLEDDFPSDKRNRPGGNNLMLRGGLGIFPNGINPGQQAPRIRQHQHHQHQHQQQPQPQRQHRREQR